MHLNYFAIILASILQFICGAIWYSLLFGNMWAKIHHVDAFSEKERQNMIKGMSTLYVVQFLMTLMTTSVLALFLAALPATWNGYGVAGFFWVGFVLPTQVSAVVFGNTEKQWRLKKIAIMSGSSLVCLMIAAAVLQIM